MEDDVIWHQSGVNQKGEPFVQLLRGDQVIGQMGPQQAREHAHAVLEAAEAAEQDAFLLEMFQKKLGLDIGRSTQIMVEFRTWRREAGKASGPTSGRDWVRDEKPKR